MQTGQPDMLIRTAHQHDFIALWPLFQGMGHIDEQSLVAQRLVRFTQSPDHFLPVACLDEDIVGYAWAQDYGFHLRAGKSVVRLYDLYVAPERRGKGVGRQLFVAVRVWASQQRMATWLQWQASQSAVLFYEQLGFKGESCPDPEHPFFEIAFT